MTMPTWYGMELVSCHAGQTLLGGITIGWILAWLCIAMWNELTSLGGEAEAVLADERDGSSGANTPEPVSRPRSVSSRQSVSKQASAVHEPDPIESYQTPIRSESELKSTAPAPVLLTNSPFVLGNPLTNRTISPEIRQ